LVQLSETKSTDVQNALVDGLFAAHNELELDISSRAVLREVAIGAGLDGFEMDEWLGSDVDGTKVDDGAQKNREMYGSVPTFIIQNEHWVDGAQDPQDFMEIFIRLKESKEQVSGA
jgi:predicted DsbA family dithiol-disulfide isomerase